MKLLEEAVNVLEVVLGASIGKWQRVAVRRDAPMSSTIATSHATTTAERVQEAGGIEPTGCAAAVSTAVVVASVVTSTTHREREGIALLESMADIVVAARIDGAALYIAQEIVKRLNGTPSRVHALNIGEGGAIGVADGAIAGVLCARLLWVGSPVGTLSHALLVGWIWVVHRFVSTGAVVRGWLSILLSQAAIATAPSPMLGRVHQYTVVGVCLDMLLQILWALERLATEITLVRLEWHMDTDMGSDVVALDGGRSACAPLAGEVEVVGTFAPDMAFADVVIEQFGAVASLATALPLTCQVVDGRGLGALYCSLH